jgi:hypothetical protein
MNDMETLSQTIGLAGSAFLAARWLAARLETTQERLFSVLTQQVAKNNELLDRVARELERRHE